MSDTTETSPPVDGRAMRSVRSRRAVIEAFLDLLADGVEQPTSQQVADRSGVSPSTIFRLFEDLDGMYAEALAIQSDRVAHLHAAVPSGGTVVERAERQVRARGRLYETVAPLIRFQLRVISSSPGARANRETVNAYLRGQLATLFADELASAPEGTLDALDAATSWEMWERLRTTQGLSVDRAEKLIAGWVTTALGEQSGG